VTFLLSPLIRYIVMGLLCGGLLIGGGLYIKAKLTDIATLSYNNDLLKESIKQQQEVIKNKTEEFVAVRDVLERTTNLNAELQNEVDDLKNKFNKRKHDGSRRDLGKLATAKDKLIEKVINKGTNDVFDCFERITSDENISIDTCDRP